MCGAGRVGALVRQCVVNEPPDLLAADSIAALFAAAGVASGAFSSTFDGPCADDTTHPCAPLLLLLQRIPVETTPRAEEAFSQVMEIMYEKAPTSVKLFDDARPDGTHDACLDLLLRHGARFDLPRHLHSRTMMRVRGELAAWAFQHG